MKKQEQLEEMARIIAFDLCPNRLIHANYGEKAQCYSDNNFAECAKIKNVVDKLYNAGYKKTFASDTQKAFQEGYIQGCIDSIQETAKELLNKFRGLLVDIGFTYMFSEDTSMIGVTLEECVDELNEMFKKYGVEVEE